jgi:hypothetical protein
MSSYEASGGDRLTDLIIEISETMGGTAVRPLLEPSAPGAEEFNTGSTLNSLRSGMTIDASPLRDAISDRILSAHVKWRGSWFDVEEVWQADAIANSIHELPGVEVLQSADHIGNNNNRCAHYVFGERFGEGWAMPDEELENEIWNDAAAFLRDKGYESVTDPEPGDVVVYSTEDPGPHGLEWIEHFAILEDNGLAVSRFGQGPVVRHPIEAVPNQYGNKVYFFRKATVGSEVQ